MPFIPGIQLPEMNPYPQPGSVLVMDNCNTHKSDTVHEAVEAAGMLLWSFYSLDVY